MNEWMTSFTRVCRDWPLDGTFICVCTFSRFKTFIRQGFSTQPKFSDATSTRTRLVLFQSFGDFSPFGSFPCSSSGGKALKLWIVNPGFLISICLMICLVRKNKRQAWKTIFAHPSEHKLLKGEGSRKRNIEILSKAICSQRWMAWEKSGEFPLASALPTTGFDCLRLIKQL